MATSFCAATAACRLSGPPTVPAPRRASTRAPRGVVALRAEAAVGGGGGINPAIRKEEEKVVDTVQTGELSKPLTPYCRYYVTWEYGMEFASPTKATALMSIILLNPAYAADVRIRKILHGAGDQPHFHCAMEAM